MSEERALDFGSIHFKLLEGACAEGIRAHETHTVALFHVVVGELGAGRGLAGALEADKHHDVWFPLFELVGFVFFGLQHIG